MNLRFRLHQLADALPPHGSVSLTRGDLVELLEADARDSLRNEPLAAVPATTVALESWRTLLWTVPSETRIGPAELCEALGRSRDWMYRHTGPKTPEAERLPCRKLDGELVFVVGELREWVHAHERVIHAPPPPKRPMRVVKD